MYYKMRILPVIIAKFGILEYLKHQNAYAIMPVGRMKWIVRKVKRKAPEIRPSGAFLFRFGKGGLFLRLIAFYSSPSNHLQMK